MIRNIVVLIPVLVAACEPPKDSTASTGDTGGVCVPVQVATPEEFVSTTTPAPPDYGCIASFSLPASCADEELNVKGLTVVGSATAPSEVRITAPPDCSGGLLSQAVFTPTGAWTVAFADHSFCPNVGEDNNQLTCDVLFAIEEPWTVELPMPDGGACSDYGELTLTFVREQTPECTAR